MQTLEDFLVTGIFAFLLCFVRVGTAVMIMPGLGDSFTPQRLRLMIALGLSLVLFPVILPKLPNPLPETTLLMSLIVMEFIIGLFFGTVARVFMMALDTAGMLVSLQSGLGNAQLFNPAFAAQGSIMGAFFSVTGVLILFATNMHHFLIYGVVGTYEMFPVGGVPDTASMAELMSRAVSASFLVGVQIAIPFLVVTMMLYIGMGVLSRLMPQVQVFILSIPVQIIVSLLTLTLTLTAIYIFWIEKFEAGMSYFLSLGP